MLWITKLKYKDKEYQFQDTQALNAIRQLRQSINDINSRIQGVMCFIGTTSTSLVDGEEVNQLVPKSQDSLLRTENFNTGDVVNSNGEWFISITDSGHSFWFSLGKNFISFPNYKADYTPQGTNSSSAVTLRGSESKKLQTQTINIPQNASKASFVKSVNFTPGEQPSFIVTDENECLILNQGTNPSLDVTSQQAVTNIGQSSQITIATGKVVEQDENGDSVVTKPNNEGTAEGQIFTGTRSTIISVPQN